MATDLYSFGNDTLAEANKFVASATQTALGGVDNVARQVESVTSRAVSMLASSAQSSVNAGQQIIRQAVDTGSQFVSMARTAVIQMATVIVGGLAQIRGAILSGLSGAAGALTRGLISLIGGAASQLGSLLTGSGVQGAATGLGGAIVGGLRRVGGSITGGLQTAFGAVQTIVGGIGSAVKSAVSSVWGFIQTVGSSFASAARYILPVLVAATAGAAYYFGAAVNRFWVTLSAGIGTVAKGIASAPALIAQAVRGIWGGITGVVGVVRAGLTTVAGWAQSALSTLAGWARSAFSFAGQIGQSLVSGIGSVVSAVSSMAATALKAGVALGQVVVAGSAIAAFAGAVWKSVEAATEFSRAARDLSGVTGFGVGKSAGLLDRLGIQGISAQSVQSLFAQTPPWVADLKARAFGLSGGPDSAGFLSSLSSRFQSLNSGGPLSQMMGQQMLKSLGLGDEWRRAAMSSPITRQANANYQRQIDSNLGLSPNALAKYAEEIPAMLQRISYGASKALLTLASVALPLVEQGLSIATKFIGDNASAIKQTLVTVTRTMFVTVGPMLVTGFATLTGMVADGVTNLVEWGTWLSQEFPRILTNLAQATANTLRSWSSSFAAWAPTQIDAFADFLIGLGATMGKVIVAVTGYIGQTMQRFGGWVNSIWANNGGPLQTISIGIATAIDGVVNAMGGALSAFQAQVARWQNFVLTFLPLIAPKLGITAQSAAAAQAAANAGIPQSNIAGATTRFFAGPTLPRFAANVAQNGVDFEQWGKDRAASLNAGFESVAESARRNGKDIVSRLSGAGMDAANFIASPDGTRNLGRDAGQVVANALRTPIDGLRRIEAPIRDFASAAQGWSRNQGDERERNNRFDKLIQLQEKNNDIVGEFTGLLRQEIRRGGSQASARQARESIFSEFASLEATALRSAR